MNKKKIQFDNLDARLKDLKRIFFNSEGLQETIESHVHLLEDLSFQILNFAEKYGYEESVELFDQISEIKNYIKNQFDIKERKRLDTLRYMFGDDLENDDFPDGFDIDDYFGLN